MKWSDFFYVFPLLAAGITYAVLSLLLRRRNRLPLDQPNERSLHTQPVPRVGGIGIVAGAMLGASGGIALLGGDANHALALSGTLLLATGLAMMSFIDDVRHLSAGKRLLAHIAAAVGFLFVSRLMGAPWFAVLALLSIVWMTNLYNFMDGSDGLAGGMAAFGFGSYALAAWAAGDGAMTVICLSLSLSALAFLRFNFHPARVFMGDVGSIPLGFLAATLGIVGVMQADWDVWFPLLVFSPFICDASVTLVRRLLRREKVWEAHREHFYQQLVQLGWGHRNTALIEYALMAVCAGTALWLREATWSKVLPVLLLFAVVYAGLMCWVHRSWCVRRMERVA